MALIAGRALNASTADIMKLGIDVLPDLVRAMDDAVKLGMRLRAAGITVEDEA